MFKFAHSEYLYFLLGIPALILIYFIFFRQKKKDLLKFGRPDVIGQLMPDISNGRVHLKFIILTLALATVVFAVAGPQFGSKLEEVKRKGIEVIIALDVSNSMMAEDIKPNRLERAKQAISRLIDRLDDDKLGLIVFAGDAYTQIPITTDYSSAKVFLSNINTDVVSKQGTAIGQAIMLGIKSFGPPGEASRVLIIISDGENHEGDAIEAAEQANENGIKVYTIGMGSPGGAPIPVKQGSYQTGFIKDNQGNVVTTKLNASMLDKIAQAGGGEFFSASNSNVGLNLLFDKLNKLDKAEIETKVFTEYEEQFQYLAGLALLLIILEFSILERKNKWLKNIDLFRNNGSGKNT